MRIPYLVAALALGLVAAIPAAAGELIRYRGPDGTVGFVDDEKRLPPGVEVVSRTPIERAAPPAAEPPAPAADAAPAPTEAPDGVEPPALEASTPSGDDFDCEVLPDLLERTRCRGAHEARCSHYGLSPRCEPDRVAAARDWCERGEALRLEIAHVADELDAARERHEECVRRGSRPRRCDEELEEAERAAFVAERRVEALEEQCHDEGCLPGWVRKGCALEPDA